MNFEELKKIIDGEIISNSQDLKAYSHDASIFEVKPQVVIKPRDTEDIKKLVKFVSENKANKPELSLTARAGGTDMSGGPLNDSIVVDFANFNGIGEIQGDTITTEPGVYYRDFEKATLAKGLLLPSYPASREICTVGGMVANNAGGEKSLTYGKTDNYVEELEVILSDGGKYIIKPLIPDELESKKAQNNFEGALYTQMHELIGINYETIQNAKPKISKNSAGYALWDVWPKRQTFDLTRLFTGSQGTLGLITRIKFRLIKPSPVSKLLVIFLKDLRMLADLINAVMRHKPESFETYDDNTLKLAIRFLPGLIKNMKGNFFSFALKFLPEFWMLTSGGIPKLVLLAEFTGNSEESVNQKAQSIKQEIQSKFKVGARITKDESDALKYWIMRRESFNLLRKHEGGRKTAPFIDDVIVPPRSLPEFLPRLDEILRPYQGQMTYTLAGHAGDGNFHIIPLMNLSAPDSSKTIQELSEKVYNLVVEFGGSITAEHNDGLMRTSYLNKMYSPQIIELFRQTKEIFDPQNIFNPGKKVGGSLKYSMNHIKTE